MERGASTKIAKYTIQAYRLSIRVRIPASHATNTRSAARSVVASKQEEERAQWPLPPSESGTRRRTSSQH